MVFALTRRLLLGTLVVMTPLFLVNSSARAEEVSKETKPSLFGVALEDLDDPVATAALLRLRDADMHAFLELGTVLSVSLASLDAQGINVDLVERSPAFTDFYPAAKDTYPGQGRRPAHHGQGGVGLTRVRMHYSELLHGFTFHDVQVLARIPLTAMDLHVVTSIGDMVMRVEDSLSGFRRVYPLGVGALDFIRIPGSVSSLTPTTEFGRFDKRGSWEILSFPKHFLSKPYLPLHLPYPRRGDDDPPDLVWRATNVAFHIWQPPRFARGFLSHGCIRMRDEDLLELAAFVYGVETHIPLLIQAAPDPQMAHPYWKLKDRYWKLKNIGTEKTPKYWIMSGIWVTEYAARAPVPAGDEIVGITMDPARLTARFDPGNPPTPKPLSLPLDEERDDPAPPVGE